MFNHFKHTRNTVTLHLIFPVWIFLDYFWTLGPIWTLILLSTTVGPYANSLDLDELPGFSPRSKLFDTQTAFSPTLSDIEALWKFKQMRSLADDNFFDEQNIINQSLDRTGNDLVTTANHTCHACSQEWTKINGCSILMTCGFIETTLKMCYINSWPISSKFSRPLMIFPNKLDPDEAPLKTNHGVPYNIRPFQGICSFFD